MTESADLFQAPAIIPDKAEPRTRWCFVTNRANLFYMLAAGLIMSPKGFGRKYYIDPLSIYPGWIPLFPDTVPKALLDLSVSERSHLSACVADIDLSGLHGPVMVVDAHGAAHETVFPDGLTGHETALLIRAPLPVSWMKSVTLETKEDKSSYLADARNYKNVSLKELSLKVQTRLFKRASHQSWPPEGLALPDHDSSPDQAIAAGGIMTMMFHMGNLGELGTRSCQLAFDAETAETASISDPMLQGLGPWQQTGHLSAHDDVLHQLFWGAVDRLVESRSMERKPDSLDVVLHHLETAAKGMDEKRQDAMERLINDLRGLSGLGDSTITELFERHPKPFPKAMMMFFLREKCSDLLDFRHPLLNELNYILAAILFGARCGWLSLPLELRDFAGLPDAVSHRMAALSHRLTDTGLDLGSPPPRPKPVRELLSMGEQGWNAKQKETALVLARNGDWDCIQTRVTLGKGEYRIVIDGRGMHFVFPGEAKAVTTDVDPERFFHQLGELRMSPQLHKKVLNLLQR